MLRLIDARSTLQSEVALNSFIAGFRLAKGIVAELQREEPSSYTKEREIRACEALEKQAKN